MWTIAADRARVGWLGLVVGGHLALEIAFMK